MSARSTVIELKNLTDLELVLTNAKLSHGEWSQNRYPPASIPAGGEAIWGSESDGFMTGTEGTTDWHLVNSGDVFVHWDNPYIGSNSYRTSAPKDYKITQSGGGGDNANVTFTLEKA